VFQRGAGGKWKQAAKLVSHDVNAHDQLGAAVAISGKTAVVGSRHNDDNTGSAYIFQPNDAGVWREVAKLKSDRPVRFGQFGVSVAISGDVVVVGEWRDSDSAAYSGAAHVFEPNGQGTWQHIQKLKARVAEKDDQFGYAVAARGSRILIGMLRMEEKRCAGSYLFGRNAQGRWTQTVKFAPTDAAPFDKFGSSVALTDDHAVIGAEAQAAFGNHAGAAYVFSVQE
jgi:hypothetical protein